MRRNKVLCLGLIIGSAIMLNSLVYAEESETDSGALWDYDSVSDMNNDALFSDERGIYENYAGIIDISTSKAEIYSDCIKIPFKNLYSKPVKFLVWGDFREEGKAPNGGAVGESKLVDPGEKGYIIVNFSYYTDGEVTLVDYRLEDDEGNYMVPCDYYGISKFIEPLVIKIKGSEVLETESELGSDAAFFDESSSKVEDETETEEVLSVYELEKQLIGANKNKK